MCVKLVLITVLAVLSFAFCQDDPYIVPRARVEVFRPRGIRVSIPDSPGIRIFAFHGVVNRELHGLESGDLSRDIVKPKNGRWVFEDNRLKLNRGDVLNYWLFVIKGNLGYRLDEQSYVVTSFQDTPPDFPTHQKNPNRHGTTTPPNSYPQYIPQTAEGQKPIIYGTCICNNPNFEPTAKPTLSPPPMCTQPTTTTTASPPSPPPTTTQSVSQELETQRLNVWRDILVNISTENAEFRNKVQVLVEMNNLLINKLDKIGDSNILKLLLVGKISQDEDPKTQVLMVLRDKLEITDSRIVKGAVRNDDGTITFTLSTIEEKIDVLLKAKEKLKNSKVSIRDIETISFSGVEGDRVVFDVRSQMIV